MQAGDHGSGEGRIRWNRRRQGQSAATFKLAKKYVPGAVTVKGVGTAAFYNPHTTAIELLKGNVVANAQGTFYNADGPQPNAAKIKADVIVLAKAVAKHI